MTDLDTYASHMAVFIPLFKVHSIRTVFEFGPGPFSTKFFCEHAQHVTAVEMDSQKWYDEVAHLLASYIANKSLDLSLLPWDRAISSLRDSDFMYDLIFVDGGLAKDRIPCLNASFNKARFVVIHDTDAECYNNLKDAQVPAGWYSRTCKLITPWTTIFCQDQDVLNQLDIQWPIYL